MSQLSPTPAKSSTPLLSSNFYNVLKHVAAIGLPALSALYYAIAQIWNINHPGQIMATISAVNACLGVLLGISTVQYNNSDAKYAGTLEVTETPDTKTYALNLKSDPHELDQQSEITLKVAPNPSIQSVSQGNPPHLGS